MKFTSLTSICVNNGIKYCKSFFFWLSWSTSFQNPPQCLPITLVISNWYWWQFWAYSYTKIKNNMYNCKCTDGNFELIATRKLRIICTIITVCVHDMLWLCISARFFNHIQFNFVNCIVFPVAIFTVIYMHVTLINPVLKLRIVALPEQ